VGYQDVPTSTVSMASVYMHLTQTVTLTDTLV